LGDRFLRHIERTRVLLLLLDGTHEIEQVLADKQTIEHELTAWNPKLAQRPVIPVITKIDVPQALARFEALRASIPGLRGISAASGMNVRELLFQAHQTIKDTPLPDVTAGDTPRFVLTPDEPFTVQRDPRGVFVIGGKRVERLAAMTDFDSDESVFRFEQLLARIGVERRLQELGIKDGDTVRVLEQEFTYS
jgi:GTP-binding protein